MMLVPVLVLVLVAIGSSSSEIAARLAARKRRPPRTTHCDMMTRCYDVMMTQAGVYGGRAGGQLLRVCVTPLKHALFFGLN